MAESLRLQCLDWCSGPTGLQAHIVARLGDQIVYTETFRLDSASARNAFAAQVAAQLNGQAPPAAELEQRLLRLLQQAQNEPPPPGRRAPLSIPLPNHESPPALPQEVLPGKLVPFVREAAEAMQVTVDLIGVFLLGSLSAAIGNARVIRLKRDWLESALLWIGVVAPPGSLKTPALALTGQALSRQQREWMAEYTAVLQAYQEELGEWERATKSERGPRPEKPVARRILVDDVTVERLAGILEENPRGVLLCRDELTGWVRAQNQYKGGKGADRSHWLSTWSSKTIIVDRKSNPQPIYIERPFVSVVGGIQPDLLDELRDPQARNDGYIDRILFCYPGVPRRNWTDATISETAWQGYHTVFNALLALETEPAGEDDQSVPRQVSFTPQGKAEWVACYNEHHAEMADPDLSPCLFGPYAKLDAYAARLALIIQLARIAAGEASEEAIDAQSALAGWALADYFKGHARRVFTALDRRRDDTRVEIALTWLRRHGGAATLRDVIRNNVAGMKTASEGEALFRNLADRGFGTVEERPNRGGRTLVFTLMTAEDLEDD